MGCCFQSLQSSLSGGEILKSKYYQYIVRVLILLGTGTSLAFLLVAWTHPVDLLAFKSQYVFACPSQIMTPQIMTPQIMTPLPSPQTTKRIDNSSELRTLMTRRAPPQAIKESDNSTEVRTLQKRGAGLLHAWTDSELFLRAVIKESILVAGKRNLTTRTPKIAFLFLIRKDIPFSPLWNKFFKGHEDLYNIYVHMWPLHLHAFQQSKGVFWGRLIPSQEGKRLTTGLIADARRLLANALLDDPSNEWFAIVSESCIPLHGFRHVYKALASTNKSFLDVSPKHEDMWDRYRARGENAMKPEIQFSQFRVGSQFWVMRRRHAVMTVGDSKYWTKFNKPCIEKYKYCFPEEHYFATLMNIMDPGGMYHSATLVDWSRMEPGGHPRRFRDWEINRDFIRDLQHKANGQFLFARKFGRDCLDPLLDIVDAILEH